MIYTYIDVETTDLYPKKSSIFQLSGFIKSPAGYDEFNIKMRPYKGETITEGASERTGKLQEELITYPDQSLGYEEFMSIMHKHNPNPSYTYRSFFIGYNSSFDCDFVRDWFLFNNNPDFTKYFYFPPIDVMHIANFALIGERQYLKNFQLSTVYKYLTGEALTDAHDAMADIKATKRILDICTSRLVNFGSEPA